MKYINMGNSGMEASEIGVGCMRMAGIEKNEAEKVIKTALEEGINFLTMLIYMEVESQKKFLQMQLI